MYRLLVFLLLLFISSVVNAADLLEVYKDALTSDPVFQQVIAQRLADKESVAINIANLLPSVGLDVSPSIYKSASSGPGSGGIGSYSRRNYQLDLGVTQNIFNYTDVAGVYKAKENSEKSDAALNVAMQALILRVALVYFAILQAQDNLYFTRTNKDFYEKQLAQVILQYKVGLKTSTDISILKASYANSVSEYIAAENQLSNQQENLRVMTGENYSHFANLKLLIDFAAPQPLDVDMWVKSAARNNWQIKVAEHSVAVAEKNKQIMFAGHLPNLNVEATYNIAYQRNTGGTGPQGSLFQPKGSKQEHTRTIQLNLNAPVFSGGQVNAQVSQSDYQLQVAKQKLEQVKRETFNATRKNYLAILAVIKKLEADRLAVIATEKSLEGLRLQYKTGLTTLLDVLDQQEKYVNAERQYAADRYAYINNALALKQEIGTLSVQDLVIVNAWLSY